MEYIAYCVKCKKKVDVQAPIRSDIETKRGVHHAVKGTCPECGTKVCVMVK